MQDKEALWAVIEAATKPELQSRLKIWLESASRQELKGLLIIKAVVKHKGQKLFKPKPKCELPQITKKHNSTYNEEFTGKTTEIFVLSHRKLKDLPASGVLNPSTLATLERWVELRDDKNYRQLMLTCLRGMAAVCSCYSPPISESYSKFTWTTPVFTAVQRSQKLTQSTSDVDLRPWVPPTEQPEAMLTTVSEFKIHKSKWKNGNGDILTWPGHTKQGTLYQDTFVAFPNQKKTVQLPRFRGSVALSRMIPSPDLLHKSRLL